ncbi:MAG: ACP S-malonyltransferase [Chloroflexaceae bacterium]|nr:ACP S-malonyltransferase [Chloroflexaceae bacterium]
MGRDLYVRYPAAREVFEEADATLNLPLTRLCFEGPEKELTATENVQPALLTVSVALLRAMESAAGGPLPPPRAVAGHSLGEYAALVAGGGLGFAEALRLVRRRGELMAEARAGGMAAVLGLDAATLEQICQETEAALADEPESVSTVVVANYNAPDQLVISGSTRAVEHAGGLAKQRGARRIVPLKVSAAFHSPLMRHAAEGMARALEGVSIRPLHTPLIANVTAEPLLAPGDVQRELVTQVTAPVRWIASVQRMARDGVTTFLEIGPGKVLSGLIRRIVPDARLLNVGNADEVREVRIN